MRRDHDGLGQGDNNDISSGDCWLLDFFCPFL